MWNPLPPLDSEFVSRRFSICELPVNRNLPSPVFFTTCFCCLLLSAVAGRAADPIRWKLAAGDELRYDITTSNALTLGDEPSVYRLDQTLSVVWQVIDVFGDGTATIEQSVERIRLKLDDPLGQVDYDSDRDDEPASLAALMAPVFESILQESVRWSISPRGEVSDVAIPAALLEAVAESPLAKSLDQFASDVGVRGFLIPRLPGFPEGEIEANHQWTETATSANQPSGAQTVETTYRFTGDEGSGSRTLATFAIGPAVTMAEQDGEAVALTSQDASGELRFNRTEGRLESSRWQIEIAIAAGEEESGKLRQEFRMERVKGVDKSL
jgi:hypothetical protein